MAKKTNEQNDTTAEPDIRIMVLQRAVHVVGRYRRYVDEHGIQREEISCGSVVRRWGTSHGLGEIAFGGPTRQTVLDPTPAYDVRSDCVVSTTKCNAAAWEKHIRKLDMVQEAGK